MPITPLTKARRGALHILAGGPARYSNETIVTREHDTIHRLIYHQTADWLCAEGYATHTADTITITAAGHERLRYEQSGVH